MKHLILIILALILIACDPKPETQTAEPVQASPTEAKPPSATPTAPSTATATHEPSATNTLIHPIFTVASLTAAAHETQGTREFPTSSIYGDATRYAQTATERARWTPPTPTQEIWTPTAFETWELVQNVNVRPDCSTTRSRIRLALVGEVVQTKPDVIFSDNGSIEWRMLLDESGCVAVRSGSNVFMVRK